MICEKSITVVNQIITLLREAWEGVQPIFSSWGGVFTSGPLGILVAIVLVCIVIFAYQEAQR